MSEEEIIKETDSADKKGSSYTICGKTFFVPSWVTGKLFSVILLLIVVGIVALVFYLYNYRPDEIARIQRLGYLGIFIISLIMNATLILPVGNVVVMAAMTTVLPPINLFGVIIPSFVCIGVIGGIAAAIGESTGYLAGFSGQNMVENKKKAVLYNKLSKWLDKWGMGLIIVMAIVPLAFDIMGLVAGALKFSYRKFLIATAIGRSIMYTFVCWGFAMGFGAIFSFIG